MPVKTECVSQFSKPECLMRFVVRRFGRPYTWHIDIPFFHFGTDEKQIPQVYIQSTFRIQSESREMKSIVPFISHHHDITARHKESGSTTDQTVHFKNSLMIKILIIFYFGIDIVQTVGMLKCKEIICQFYRAIVSYMRLIIRLYISCLLYTSDAADE